MSENDVEAVIQNAIFYIFGRQVMAGWLMSPRSPLWTSNFQAQDFANWTLWINAIGKIGCITFSQKFTNAPFKQPPDCPLLIALAPLYTLPYFFRDKRCNRLATSPASLRTEASVYLC